MFAESDVCVAAAGPRFQFTSTLRSWYSKLAPFAAVIAGVSFCGASANSARINLMG